VARHESEHKSERVKLKMAELIKANKLPGGCGSRPFGFERDMVTLREDEADLIRDMVNRTLAGESTRSLIFDLNRRQIPTSTGRKWTMSPTRTMLLSPRLAGMREFNGQLIKAPWPAIIPLEQHRSLRALAAERKRTGERAVRGYPFFGLLRCGLCGTRMMGFAVAGKGRYQCRTDRGGCNKIGIIADPVEKLAAEAIFEVVDSPDFSARLAEANGRPPEVGKEMEAIERRMNELATAWADGDITRAEWQTARGRLQERLDHLRDQLVRTTRDSVLDHWVDRSLREAWPSLNVHQKRAIARAVLSEVVIAPADPHGPRVVDPRRVTIHRRF